MDRLGAGDLVDGGLGEADGLGQAGLDEFGHGAPALLHGDGRVDAVELVQVHVVGPEPQQARLARGAQVLRAAVAVGAAGSVDDQTALGGEHDLVAAPAQRLPDEPLVRERAVLVGGVEEADSHVDGLVDDPHRRRVVPSLLVIAPGHAHAAQSHPTHGRPFGSQVDGVHRGLQGACCQGWMLIHIGLKVISDV